VVRSVAEQLSESEVFVHVDVRQPLNVHSAVAANKVRQCRRDLLQLIDNHSLVGQLTHLNLTTPHNVQKHNTENNTVRTII